MPIHASKLLIKKQGGDAYFVVYRADHPHFGNSIDLPGGLVEKGESALEATVREVYEEAAMVFEGHSIREVVQTKKHSLFNVHYTLYATEVETEPSATLSWEHESYEWVSKDHIIQHSRASNDSYMHMVADYLESL